MFRILSTFLERFNSYQVLIHGLLIILAITVAGLTKRNQELREPPVLETSSLEKGEPFTAFPAFDLEGGSRLVDLAQGDRDSLVFVFTTVCPACRENQAIWQTLYEQAKERYEIIGISLNEIDPTAEYREANGLPFSVVVPEDIQGFATAHKIDRVPITLQIDRDGKVEGTWLGVLTKDSLAQLTASLAVNG